MRDEKPRGAAAAEAVPERCGRRKSVLPWDVDEALIGDPVYRNIVRRQLIRAVVDTIAPLQKRNPSHETRRWRRKARRCLARCGVLPEMNRRCPCERGEP
jgi:hypothetical protein